MSSTSTRISFGLYALEIKQDSTAECDDLQSFSDLVDLKTDQIIQTPYITYEPDYWLLNGDYKFLPTDYTNVHFGLMSLSMSDENGDFSDSPVLTITFSEEHTTDGLVIRFARISNDFANSITVAYYDASDVLIRSDNYVPTSWEFSTEQSVENFKKIIITFNSTNKPYRYLRVQGIDYGELIYFEDEDIKSVSVVEQIDPLSTKIYINEADIEIFSNDAEFNIINPGGSYAALQYRQPLTIYETVDELMIYIGQFYLNKWESPSENQITFKCVDILGVLDSITYLGGIWLTATTAELLIDAILDAVSVPYELHPDLEDVEIKGWIPVCSYRKALQQIAFAIGAYITCSRSGVVKIYPTILAEDIVSDDTYTITDEDQGINPSVTLRTLVTGIELIAHNYISNTEETELYNGTLAIGEHIITFIAPMHDLNITGGTITESGANYAVVNVTVEGTVVLSGEGYTDTTRKVNKNNESLSSSVRLNILSITDATLVNPDNATDLVEQIYSYYQQRYLQKLKLYAPEIAPADMVLSATLFDQEIKGIVEKMDLDLSGGFIAKTEIVGVINE